MAHNDGARPHIPLKPTLKPKPQIPQKPLLHFGTQVKDVNKTVEIFKRPHSSPVGPAKPPRTFQYRPQTKSVNLENILHGHDVTTAYEENEYKLLKKSISAAPNNVSSVGKDQERLTCSQKPLVPVRPTKLLHKRPLPALPNVPVRFKQNSNNIDELELKKRHGLLIDETILNELKEDLKKNTDFYVPRSNLSKLKSVSSPSLFNRDSDCENEIKTLRYSTENLLIDVILERDDDVDNIDGGNGNQVPKQKFHKKIKDVTTHGFAKGIKKWQSFAARKHETFNVVKKDISRPRADTTPIEVTFDKYSDLYQDDESALFDHVLVVSLKPDEKAILSPYISFCFPPKIDEDSLSGEENQVMESIPQFCFPDPSLSEGYGFKNGETFSFVLTDVLGKRNFGYCKLIKVSSSKYPEVYCIISPHGLFSMYSQILEEVEKQRNISATAVFSFLKAVLSHSLPKPSSSVIVSFFTSGGSNNIKEVTLKRPGDSAIHEHVDLSLLFATLPISVIIQLLTCMLVEAKLIICSSSLSLLSSCCHALISLMYPFTWEHTYIPVLPTKLVDIICLPSPYLIGLLPPALQEMEDLPVDDVTVVSLDDGVFLRQESVKVAQLPKQIKEDVTAALDEIMCACRKSQLFGASEQKAQNQVITEVFVQSYLNLIGHFEEHYTENENHDQVITGKGFYKASHTKEKKQFLKVFMQTQAFQQFAISRKQNGPSQGLFENRFAEWKKRSGGHHSKPNFKDLLTGFKRKLKL